MSPRQNQEMVDHFSNLPAELRCLIYEALFVTENFISVDAPPARNLLAILRTCKLVCDEAAPLFYRKNEFLFTRNSSKLFGPISPGYLPDLRKIAISISTGHPALPATMEKAALVRAPVRAKLQLDQVSIDIRSDLHPMTVSAFDDSLLDRMHPIAHALSALIRSGVAKHVRIRLASARFGPDTASILQKVFQANVRNNCAESTLTFFVGHSYTTENIVTDLSQLERRATGIYTSAPMSLGNFNDDDLTFGSLPLLGHDLCSSLGLSSSDFTDGRSVLKDGGLGHDAESSHSAAVETSSFRNDTSEQGGLNDLGRKGYDVDIASPHEDESGEGEEYDYDMNMDEGYDEDKDMEAMIIATAVFAPQLF